MSAKLSAGRAEALLHLLDKNKRAASVMGLWLEQFPQAGTQCLSRGLVRQVSNT